MSSFFTVPASQKKRKRTDVSSSRPARPASRKTPRNDDDDSISGSDESEDNAAATAQQATEPYSSEDEDFSDEDANAKRVRLAEQYLANTQKEILADGGFDAADVDQENLRRRMGERLKEDTAESKGKLYRWLGDDLDWARATRRTLHAHGVQKSFTGVAGAEGGRVIFAVSKDMQVLKWEISTTPVSKGTSEKVSKKARITARSRGRRNDNGPNSAHHHAPILCIAVSQDGKFVATGGADKKLIVWSGEDLRMLKVFPQHRDAVSALAFRRGTHQLFSASKDRTVKIWSLDELAYVDTLFGHQDEVVDVAALAQEKCVTVGARDRSARLWKVVEESQLVFRGGGSGGGGGRGKHSASSGDHDSGVDVDEMQDYHAGSMDRVAMIDDETFVTASDNGALSLWNINKKKPIFTLRLAHGVDPALAFEQSSAELHYPSPEADNEKGRGGRQARWITALRAIPFSDVIVSASWDGSVRAWKISRDKRRIESLGPLGQVGADEVAMGTEMGVQALLASEGLSADAMSKSALQAIEEGVAAQQQQQQQQQQQRPEEPSGKINGVVNDLMILESGTRGSDGVIVAAAVGKEHRLGRWKEVDTGSNRVVMFQVSRKGSEESESDGEAAGIYAAADEGEDFEGFH